jgi:long-chain acyl-CoA synthetase
MSTVVHLLASAASARPEAIALVLDDRRLTYREYAQATASFAHVLKDKGERIATLLPNSIEACIAMFGVLASGAQLVPLNPLYTLPELEVILEDADVGLLITDGRLAVPRNAPSVLKLFPGNPGFEGKSLAPPDRESLALLQYTGGTTGKPKGVNLTHRAIATNVAQREALLPTAQDRERILCVMPLFHSYAMAMGLFLAVNCRGTLVVLERYKPETLLAAIERERITIFPGSPTLFTSLLAHPQFERTDWSSVHTCYSGSAPLSEGTLKRWQEAVGAPVYEGYGQTEAGPVLTFNPARGVTKPGSVGIPVPDTELRIVDGEIVARGPQIMRGYRNRPRETAQALRAGWLHTGDMGELDADGYLHVRGRKKDMAIVGGYNVYPREVEEVLCSHPAVSEAAVVGGPDPYWGECLHAYVVPRQTIDEATLLGYCRERLAKYKIPSTLEIVDALPRTSLGKIDKLPLKSRWTTS